MGRGVIQRTGDLGEQGQLKIRMKKKHLPPPGLEGQREKLVFRGPEAGAAVACAQTTGCSNGARAVGTGIALGAAEETQSRPADVGDAEQRPGLSLPPAFQVQPVFPVG